MLKPTVDAILDKCGGDIAVAFRLKLHQFSISRWRTTGIPAKRWREVIEIYEETNGGTLTLEDLMSANELTANERTKRSA